MKNILSHLITCRACLIDDCRFCPQVSPSFAQQYRERAEQKPSEHQAYVSRVLWARWDAMHEENNRRRVA